MNGFGAMVWAAILAALSLAAIGFIPAAAPALEPPPKTSSPASVLAASPPQPDGGPAAAKADPAFRRDTGPAAGPAREAGLERLGRLRLRRSEEIGDSRWGVSCHWIADEHPLAVEQRLEHLSALGIKWAFLVPDWDRIEREKGRYEWSTPSHRLDDVVTGLVRRKITPIIQIYGGSRLYMPAQMDPNLRQLADAAKLLDDPEVRQAWHRFLEALVRRYQPHVRVWEIWNEPNGPWFWQTPTSVKDYGRMVKTVAEIIRRVQPEALILAGSTANVPRDYLEAFLSSDGAGSFSHWSVHPYGELPEATDAQIRSAAELLRMRGKSPVLWQSECGFPSSADTAGWGYGGAWDETKHAKWVLRRLLSDAALGMPVSIYFVLHDYPGMLEGGPNQGQMGINRKGLYWYGSWERKPAAHAMAHLSSLLDDRWEPVSTQPIGFEITAPGTLTAAKTEQIKMYRLKHKLSGQPALIYWLGVPMATRLQPARVTLTWPGAEIAQPVLVDLLDGGVYAVPHETQSGKLRMVNLPLADSPLVLCSRSAVELVGQFGSRLSASGRELGQATEPAAEAGVTLLTASTRLEFTSPGQGLLLRRVVHIPTGTEFLPQAGAGRSVWEIVLLNAERKLCSVKARPGASFATERDESGATVYRLSWPKLDLPDAPGALGVSVKIAVPRGSGLSYWQIEVANRSKAWGVWEVRFPRLEHLGPVGDPAEDLLLDPMIQGRLTSNPYLGLQKASCVRDAPVQTAGQNVHYPGYASFQMCALYHPERAGLYYAAYDGRGYYKHLSFGPHGDGRALDLYVRHFPEGQGLPGTGYMSPFPVVIGTFAGDWMTAAKLYREWAVRQVWCSAGKRETRADVPQWYKDLAVWEFITANSYAAMHHYRNMLGVPWANHWNYIWKDASQGDKGSPDLFPPKGGEAQMREETAKLAKTGVYTVPYFLGSALDVKSPQYAQWKMDPVLVRGGESHYALGNPDTPYIWVYSPEMRFAWPCPHLDFWPEKAVGIVRQIMQLGATGVYLDTTTGNAYQCFSKDHGHSVGGGNYWAQGTRRYLKRIRSVVKEINPDGIMTGENPCEVYNDLMDGYLLYVAHFPTSVPAFQAIYHDYVGTYGQFLSSPAKIGKDYPFMLPMGICFINGDQFGCTARTDYTMQAQGAKDMAWLRRLAHFRVKVVNRYVGLGEMLRTPKLEAGLPKVSGWWWPWPEQPPWNTRTVTRPAVIHSAWRASDGSVGLVFLNISEQPQRFALCLEGEQWGFAPGADLTVAALGLDQAEKPTRETLAPLSRGKGRIEHTLEPRGMWAMEVKLTECPKRGAIAPREGKGS